MNKYQVFWTEYHEEEIQAESKVGALMELEKREHPKTMYDHEVEEISEDVTDWMNREGAYND